MGKGRFLDEDIRAGLSGNMAEHEINTAQLRNFALITSAMFVLLFGVLPWLWNGSLHNWPWFLALVLSAWGILGPATLRPVYTSWMRLAHVLGTVNNRLLLGIMYFTVLLPIGLVKRLFGSDSIKRHYDPSATSYRIKKKANERDHLERPY